MVFSYMYDHEFLKLFNSFFILLLYLTKRSFLAVQMYLSAKDWMELLKCTHTFKSKLLFLKLQWRPWLHKKQRRERPGMRLIYSQLICMVAFIWCSGSSFTKLNAVILQWYALICAISLWVGPLIMVQISRYLITVY